MGIRTRLISAAVAAAMLTAVGAAAVPAAAAPASPSTSAVSDGKKQDNDAVVAKVAASLHVSVQQLVTALNHLKQAVGNGTDMAAAVAAFAKELRITVADAEKALQALSTEHKGKPGKGKDAPSPEVVKALAAALNISADRARQVLRDLENVKTNGDDVVRDPAFIAIAKGLHLTPEQLLATLIKVKQSLPDKPKEPKPTGTPTK